MKKTKIVATIGPATEKKEMLSSLLEAGMNVMRLNFSHGDFKEHQTRVNNLKAAMKATGKRAAILQDLGGPKIRIGNFSTESVDLTPGKLFTLTTDDIVGDVNRVSINYKKLPQEVAKGHIIFLHDGKKKLEVVDIKGNDIITKILVGGSIKGRRGVNLPDSDLTISCLTEKDKEDVKFGIKNKVDFVALSFVRKPADIDELRAILKAGKCDAKIIAKIETPQAIRAIDEIIEKTDGIMIARGDLAIEVPAQKVPVYQKEIIRKCNNAGKPVITATQMLESMIHSPVPTRAEVSDVANAIFDGTDAIMLSEETTLGEYPVEAVEMMSKIAEEVETENREMGIVHMTGPEADIEDSLTTSLVRTAHDVGAKAIVALTESGLTARIVSRHKPDPVIIAFSPSERTCNQLCLSYGCIPVEVKRYKTLQEVFAIIRKYCVSEKIAKKGDRVVVAAGAPFNKRVPTNMILVETI